jgi:hypothetical protein
MDISKIISALEKHGVRCSIVGGCAVALHGVVRGTIDLDLVIEHKADQFSHCEAALTSLGFVSRLPVTANEVYQFRDEYVKNRNMLAWSFYKPDNPMHVVDILITKDLCTLTSTRIKSATFSYPVISLADLVQMKKEAGRPQDLEDLKLLEPLLDAQKKKK